MVSLKRFTIEAHNALKKVKTVKELEDLWRAYFGASGRLAELLRGIGMLSKEKRPREGKLLHELRAAVEKDFLSAKKRILAREMKQRIAREWLDVTLPAQRPPRGHLHPLTIVRRKIEDIFVSFGFSVVDGPEVESERYNFDALNIPADHPARDMWDTLWLRSNHQIPSTKSQNPNKSQVPNPKIQTRQERLLLRTHTSPVQVRYMEQHEPPFRIIVPGRVFRYEATDASHDIQFHQIEGLVVGKKGEVTAAHFKAIMGEMVRRFFGKALAVRLRPSYFPFVEPGFEVDIQCTICGGSGDASEALRRPAGGIAQSASGQPCAVCRGTGWLEMMGAGMVHPAVFEAVRYNPRTVQGFAFGLGLERFAMLQWRIPDIRLFRSGDTRFLRQF